MTRAVESLVLVESDTAHPLLDLLGLEVAEAANVSAAASVQASSRDEWAQAARRLERQGKDEQVRAIRDTFLQAKTAPWAPWSETVMRELPPRALDHTQPSGEPLDAELKKLTSSWMAASLSRVARTGAGSRRAQDGERAPVRWQTDATTNLVAR